MNSPVLKGACLMGDCRDDRPSGFRPPPAGTIGRTCSAKALSRVSRSPFRRRLAVRSLQLSGYFGASLVQLTAATTVLSRGIKMHRIGFPDPAHSRMTFHTQKDAGKLRSQFFSLRDLQNSESQSNLLQSEAKKSRQRPRSAGKSNPRIKRLLRAHVDLGFRQYYPESRHCPKI